MNIRFALLLATALCGGIAEAAPKAQTGTIAVTVEGMAPGKPIPEAQALCTPTTDGKSDTVKAPLRPTIRWHGAPKTAASLAVFVMDPDVPADFTDAGKEGKQLAADMKRRDFFHYGVVNIPADATELAGGAASEAPAIGQELLNDLGANGYVTPATAYGGPCPPWNDARLHHYHFIVLALDKNAPVAEATPRDMVVSTDSPNTAKRSFDRLMQSGHVLAKGTVIGTYTLNQSLRTGEGGGK